MFFSVDHATYGLPRWTFIEVEDAKLTWRDFAALKTSHNLSFCESAQSRGGANYCTHVAATFVTAAHSDRISIAVTTSINAIALPQASQIAASGSHQWYPYLGADRFRLKTQR